MKPAKPHDAALGRQAEERLQSRMPPANASPAAAEALRLLHELQVHQIELEMQNEELRVALTMVEKLQESEEELLRSQNFSQSILETTANLIYIYAIQENRNIYSNPCMLQILGYSPEEVRDQGEELFANILHPEDFTSVGEHHRRLASAPDHQVLEVEYRMKHAKGQWITLRSRDKVFVRDELGMVREIIGTAEDITARKQAEAEQDKLEKQLIQSQKMEAVGRLAGGVAHDFNNMLGVILGHAELALIKMSPEQPLFDGLQEIRKAAERSAELTRQLLAFARKQTIMPRVLDLNETVDGMLKMLGRLIGEDIDLVWLPGENLAPLEMDPSQIDQVLANLCVNARHAIAGTGRIIIETENVCLDGKYCADHSGFVPGDYVALFVSDTGCGMNKETQEVIFEPFFTTMKTGEGTGLGLATVYGIVKQNSGFIEVASEPGQGTTFSIFLPAHAGSCAQLRTEEPGESIGCGEETVLLVEDEPTLLTMSKIMLETLGYRVIAVSRAEQAVELVEKHGGEIQLLISDVIMPAMNGRDLSKRLLAINPQLRCLFMSGYTADIITNHGVLGKGMHFIQKPFSRKELAEKIRKALA